MNEGALLARRQAGDRIDAGEGAHDRDGRCDEADDNAGALIEHEDPEIPQNDDRNADQAGAQPERPFERAQQGAEQRDQDRQREILAPGKLRRLAVMQELRDAVRQDQDARHGGARIARIGRERRAVLVDEREMRADQDDLVLEDRLRKERGRRDAGRPEAGWQLRERRLVLAFVGVPDDRDLFVRGRYAGDLRRAALHAEQALAAGGDAAGIDPTHRVGLVGAEIGQRAILGRNESVEIGGLVGADGGPRLVIADDQRRLHRAQHGAQRVVLVRLGRAVEQVVEHDRLGMLGVQRGQQLRQEAAVERRAIGEVLHHAFVDREDQQVGILRLRRRLERDLPVLDEAFGACKEGNAIDRIGRQERHGERHRDSGGSLVARQDLQPAKQCIHVRGRSNASACASQPFCTIQAARIWSFERLAGTLLTASA